MLGVSSFADVAGFAVALGSITVRIRPISGMGEPMRYEILGALRVIDGRGPSTISAQKRQTLLATLLIRAGQEVSAEQLINEVWGDERPKRVQAALHVYISQLRKFLSPDPDSPARITTETFGYALRLGDDELDVRDFLRGIDRGRERARAGDHAAAAEDFERALALWHGPPLRDLRDGPIISAFTTWLEETRLECLERLVDARLALGQHRGVIGHLSALTMDHPLHEAFYRQLMLALYRSERRADALRVYLQARRVLQDELGLDPGRALRDLHRSILAADHRLDVARTA